MKVLISGSGIAGASFATWLLRAFPKADIEIVERWSSLRTTGAAVDIRNAAVSVIEKMGIEPEVRANHTGERGLRFVRRDDTTIATLGMSDSTQVQSFTSAYEIMRGTLSRIIMDSVKPRVKLTFDEYVEHYEELDSGVKVSFRSGRTDDYDLVVAADGYNSKIRAQMTGHPAKDDIWDEGVHIAYWTPKMDLLEGSKIAKVYTAPKGRNIMIRPDPRPDRCSVLLMRVRWRNDKDARVILDDAVTKGHEAYKTLMEEQFSEAGWLTPEVFATMHDTDDFYCSNFAQVRSPKYQSGRVVLLGDAGYATPGIGTSLALCGAYVLAGELLNTPKDIPAATARYEEIMRPIVKSEQSDGQFMQYINPQSQLGLTIRDVILQIVGILGLDQIAMRLSSWLGIGDKPYPLPEYSWPTAMTDEKGDM